MPMNEGFVSAAVMQLCAPCIPPHQSGVLEQLTGDRMGWLSAAGLGAVTDRLEALQDKGFSLLPVSANSYCN